MIVFYLHVREHIVVWYRNFHQGVRKATHLVRLIGNINQNFETQHKNNEISVQWIISILTEDIFMKVVILSALLVGQLMLISNLEIGNAKCALWTFKQ